MTNRPSNEMNRRELHFIWLLDCSGSMAADGKIQSLNMAVREAVPHLRATAATNPFAQVLVRAITFSDGAAWHVPTPTPVDHFVWADIAARGRGATDMGEALKLVALEIARLADCGRLYPPALVLVSDGRPTDDFAGEMRNLLAIPEAAKAIRISIAIGRDADIDTLQEFMGRPDLKPLRADNPEMLVSRIRFASTVALTSSAAPRSILARTIVEVPVLAADKTGSAGEDVW